jgi:hypothetical protein
MDTPIITHKTCTKCKETKPALDFYILKTSKDGLCNYCKVCKLASNAPNVAKRNREKLDAAAKLKAEKDIRRQHLANSGMKMCSACDTPKLLTQFHVSSTGRFGLTARCATCTQAYTASHYDRNKDEIKLKTSRYAKTHREESNTHKNNWRERNTESSNAQSRAWAKANPSKRAAYEGKRRATKLKRSVMWADTSAINSIFSERDRRTLEVGTPHHVDHIIPLEPITDVAPWGLHNEFNLQILTAQENQRKSNRFNPDTYVHSIPQATGPEPAALARCLNPHRVCA